MPADDVFRFMTVRAIQRRAHGDFDNLLVEGQRAHGEMAGDRVEPAAHPQSSVMPSKRMSRSEARAWAGKFINSEDFIASLNDIEVPLVALDQFLLRNHDQVSGREVIEFLSSQIDGSPANLVASASYKRDRLAVMASLCAVTLMPSGREALRNALLRAMQLFGLLERLATSDVRQLSAPEIPYFLLNAVVLLPNAFPVPAVTLARPPAIADLKVVRQELQRYEAGEIAYIENVLAHEARSRTHRRKDVREATTLIETEKEQIQDQELQTSDRYELQREASSVIRDDSQFQAGITVTAAYGPTISATANAGYEASHSQEESKRVASTYAREVTERSSRRIRERVREQRTTRTVSEVEETNEHGIDNSASSTHVVGIYRYVDKIYQAQVFNYGKRLMLEFIVPEPAAFARQALSAALPLGSAVKPETPMVTGADRKPRALAPTDLTAANYLQWVAKYFVRDAALPPAATIYQSITLEEPAKPDSGIGPDTPSRQIYKASKEIEVPPGYLATHIKGVMHVSDYVENILLTVGAANIALTEFARGAGISFDVDLETKVSGRVPLAVRLNSTWGYDLAALVRCDLQADGLVKWQLETYEKVMSAYFELKSLYDEQVAAAQSRQSVLIQGRNPAANRQIERNELKRNVIEMLEQQHFDQAPLQDDAVRPVAPQSFPGVNFSAANAERDFIQWFEQAFEWPQMTYVFYPYYWNKKENWPQEISRTDTDPLFADFLKAGAARVLVPVRPGFERAMALYLSTGIIWNGQQVPQIGDSLYVSLVQEIQSQQDAEFAGIAEGTPWPVRLPTTLVVLQEDGVLRP